MANKPERSKDIVRKEVEESTKKYFYVAVYYVYFFSRK